LLAKLSNFPDIGRGN
ncbi:hypothetical protein NPIL_652161, partial [Nephila pilipes]